jgi:hypothetical protein
MIHPADIAAFIAKWRVSTLKERSAAQEHFMGFEVQWNRKDI